MLNWLTVRRYNYFDLIWYCWAVLAWHDCNWLACFVAVVIGILMSVTLEQWNDARQDRGRPG